MQLKLIFHCLNKKQSMKLHLPTPAYFLAAILFFSCTKSNDLSKAESGDSLGLYSGSSNAPGGSNSGGTAGVITAGEWNDLDNWDFWKTLMGRDTIKDIPATWSLFTNNAASVILNIVRTLPK